MAIKTALLSGKDKTFFFFFQIIICSIRCFDWSLTC